MPITVRCPECDETFQADENERAECPACGRRFDPPRRRISHAEPVERVPELGPGALPALLRGSLLQILANGMTLIALLVLMILLMMTLESRPAGPGKGREVAMLFVSIVVLVSWFLNLIAGACWAMAATRGTSQPLGVALLVLSALVLFRGINVSLLLTEGTVGRGGHFEDLYGPNFLMATYYIEIARMIVLSCYLTAAAGDTGRQRAQVPGLILAIVTPVFLLTPVGLSVLMGLFDKGSREWGAVLVLLMVAGALVVTLWTVVLLLQLRGAWGRMARSGETS